MRVLLGFLAVLALLALAASSLPAPAGAYGWPVKPFYSPHAIRASFGDPRYHLDAEGTLSAFHFGIDIVARDGSPVYSVEPGVVVRRHPDSVTVGRASGRRYSYWHIRPVVRSGTHVRLHQLLGHVIAGWGHVHFAESFRGSYRNPLRKGALSPFYDNTLPTVGSIQLLRTGGGAVETAADVSGLLDVQASIYDTPPIAPPAPWSVARLAPDEVDWALATDAGAVVASGVTISFQYGLPINDLYSFVYAPGTYQNKPLRPGQYVYWVEHALDTTEFPNGGYKFEVSGVDTRGHVGTSSVELTIANPGSGPVAPPRCPITPRVPRMCPG
jgi:murein DD-endopeptidase MepM/ murein hydrolase activator NlpD